MFIGLILTVDAENKCIQKVLVFNIIVEMFYLQVYGNYN